MNSTRRRSVSGSAGCCPLIPSRRSSRIIATHGCSRHGTGDQRLAPLRVEYLQPRTNLRAIERHFGCEVIAGASRNAIIFRAADATAPFVTRNAELLDLLA